VEKGELMDGGQMDGEQASVVRSRYTFIALLVLTLSCGVLLWMNHALQKQARLLVEQVRNLSAAQGPPVGSSISFLRGHTISGQNVTLDLSNRQNGTLLLVLSPTCRYTKLNFPHWRDLLPLVPSDQVVYVDLTGTADSTYLASVTIPASANVIRLDPEERTLYSLGATPTTVLLGPHGVVRGVWAGLMRDDQVDQLRELLRLPRV